MSAGRLHRLELTTLPVAARGRLHRVELTTESVLSVSAGAGQFGLEPGTTVTLSGVVTTGAAASVVWRQVDGPTVTLSSTTANTVTYTAPPNLTGVTLTFGFTATDAESNESDEGIVTHTVLYSTQRVVRSGVQVPLLVNVNRT